MAVQQTFGIGLGFGFDHMRPLAPGETPSTRRLQARAAKSAIKRAQEIYDPTATRQVLDAIHDPVERNRKATELRQQAEQEIQYLASRLSELIPTDPSPDIRNSKTRVQQYAPNDFVRTSKNELVLIRPSGGAGSDDSPAIRFLLENYGKTRSENNQVDFVEAWVKQNREWTGQYDNSTDTTKTELV